MIPELAKWQLFVGLFNPNLSTIYSMGFVDIIMVQKLCSSTTITHIFDEIQAAPTWVCVIPKLAANSARSGNARYCVLWNRRSNCWICKDEYMDRGFRIFFPFPLTRVISSPCSTTRSGSPENGSKTVRIRVGCVFFLMYAFLYLLNAFLQEYLRNCIRW